MTSIIEWLNEPNAYGVPKHCDFKIGADMGIEFIEDINKVLKINNDKIVYNLFSTFKHRRINLPSVLKLE